ncbi:hypothetical protein R3P38DRAFT_2809346 [Favolaschia claudopus]|uniref:Uncharacterized protein n=1 Tax=Favolaschia claudopus TaxID=2862362 RepID=A0AAV9ZDB9_9AGAR
MLNFNIASFRLISPTRYALKPPPVSTSFDFDFNRRSLDFSSWLDSANALVDLYIEDRRLAHLTHSKAVSAYSPLIILTSFASKHSNSDSWFACRCRKWMSLNGWAWVEPLVQFHRSSQQTSMGGLVGRRIAGESLAEFKLRYKLPLIVQWRVSMCRVERRPRRLSSSVDFKRLVRRRLVAGERITRAALLLNFEASKLFMQSGPFVLNGELSSNRPSVLSVSLRFNILSSQGLGSITYKVYHVLILRVLNSAKVGLEVCVGFEARRHTKYKLKIFSKSIEVSVELVGTSLTRFISNGETIVEFNQPPALQFKLQYSSVDYKVLNLIKVRLEVCEGLAKVEGTSSSRLILSYLDGRLHALKVTSMDWRMEDVDGELDESALGLDSGPMPSKTGLDKESIRAESANTTRSRRLQRRTFVANGRTFARSEDLRRRSMAFWRVPSSSSACPLITFTFIPSPPSDDALSPTPLPTPCAAGNKIWPRGKLKVRNGTGKNVHGFATHEIRKRIESWVGDEVEEN